MKFKRFIILIVNIAIVGFLFAGVSIYAETTNAQYINRQKDLFVSETSSSQVSLYRYLKGEQQLVNSWAKYISESNFSLEEGFSYLQKSVDDDSYSAHIISLETFEGYSTKTSSSNDVHDVSYADTSKDETFGETIVRNAIPGLTSDGINMLSGFPDLLTGVQVVGFCQKVNLNESGKERSGLVIRFLRQDGLVNRWNVKSSIDKAYCALISSAGNYIIRPAQMKGTIFYEYIFSNNRTEYSTLTIKALLTNNPEGSFVALNQNKVKTMYSWSTITEGSNTAILIHGIALSEFNAKSNSFTLVYLIIIVLALLLLVNVFYFLLVQHRETKLRSELELNIATIEKQEALLKDALEEANQSNKAKSIFLNNMSHDIRTPMNAIIGYASIAQKSMGDQNRVEDSLDKIMISSQHLLGLINDILDMSKIEAGKMTLDCSPINIGEVLHNLRNIVQTSTSSKNLNLSMNTINVEHLNVVCDKLRLNQVLINLLSNSVKFTESGGTISLCVEELPSDNPSKATFKFSVIDNGIGMSEEFQKKLFERFERETSSSVSKIAGTGLGMSIVKSLVEMMDGTISVQSKQGEGTRIDIVLSLEIVETSKDIDYSIDALRGSRALIVDDEFACCDSLNKMLRKIGMNSEWTLYGKEAVLRAKKAHEDHEQFDVFIIDWIMPDMNGVEVVRQIRSVIGNDTPIIILTAYDYSAIEEEARKAGVTAFLAKPLFIDELTRSLSGALGAPVIKEEKERLKTFENKTCLLVDDNEFNREVATFMLEEHKLTVETAENGKEAVDKVLADIKRYDIVFMDIQMPVMNGFEATSKIRESGIEGANELPIIAMTANTFKEDVEMSLKARMNDHIAKPIDVQRLEQILAHYLSK